MRRSREVWAVLIGSALLLVGCGGTTTVGHPAAPDTPAVPLREVLASPDVYDGRTVVLRGTLTGLCADRCEFTYTEDGTSVTIYMSSAKAPRVPVGQPVRVTAKVHKGKQQVVITAVGLEVLPGGPRR